MVYDMGTGGESLHPNPRTMTNFSILCTNTRNGGQHELVIEAANKSEAIAKVAVIRPHYIVKRIDAIT